MSNTASHTRTPRLSRWFFVLTVALGFYVTPAQAEISVPAAYNWVSNLGPIGFNGAGGAFLDPNYLGAVRGGSISPIMQFVGLNNLLNQCIKDVVSDKFTPAQRDPYLVAKKKFEYGICRVKKCWQQGMLLQALPLASRAGDGNSSFGAILAGAFAEDPACDGSGEQNGGLDPQLLYFLGFNGSGNSF